MTKILANDYNTLSDTLAALYGTGTGTRGYGQTSLTLSHVTAGAGNKILASQWNTLRSVVTVLGNHQGTSIGSLPATFGTGPGHTVNAADLSALQSLASTLDTNRANFAPSGEMSVSPNVYSNTRATDWGFGVSNTITSTFSVSWADEDHARWFFNAGGQIRVRLNHSNTTTPQDTAWANYLTAIGTLQIAASACSVSGGTIGQSPASFGYFGLTGTDQTLFHSTDTTGGAYSANNFNLQAHATGIVGLHGGNGSAIQISVSLQDAHTNSVYYIDTVHSGTTVTVDIFRSTNNVSTVLPSVALVSSF